MINTSQINQWVFNPSLLKNIEHAALEQFVNEHPSFGLGQMQLHYAKNGLDHNGDLREMIDYNPTIFALWEIEEWASNTEEPIEASVSDQNRTEKGFDMPMQTARVDYFTQQGLEVSNEIPEEMVNAEANDEIIDDDAEDKSLMVVMSFTEWLQFLQQKTKKEEEEEQEKRALKAMWQKQKMAEAMEEENDEIPPTVFEMAVNSIQREDGIISESMALVYAKQGKTQQAIDMYKKLSLQNPNKSAYFAQLIEELEK